MNGTKVGCRSVPHEARLLEYLPRLLTKSLFILLLSPGEISLMGSFVSSENSITFPSLRSGLPLWKSLSRGSGFS